MYIRHYKTYLTWVKNTLKYIVQEITQIFCQYYDSDKI